MARTVDITPTWRGVLPALLIALEIGTDEGKRIAREELRRMAEAADAYNAAVKAGQDDLDTIRREVEKAQETADKLARDLG